MKTILLHLILICSACTTSAQKVTDIIYFDENGQVKKAKKATHFIVIKQKPDNGYERSYYPVHGPLEKLESYSDASFTILEGKYLQYNNGRLEQDGTYHNNQKNGIWYYYNDTFKVIKKEKYLNGTLLWQVQGDSLAKLDTIKFGAEKEAEFAGGPQAWWRYLVTNIDANVALNSVSGGKVIVIFCITKEGKPVDIYIRKSVEYVLDEEALRVCYKMPSWNPAMQKGKPVNFYAAQPISFVKPK